jgi:SAM-dependent methyltransferase
LVTIIRVVPGHSSAEAAFLFLGVAVMNSKEHWENVYHTKAPDEVSWYSSHLGTSLKVIEQRAPDRSSPIIDVGGGASTLVDDLVARGYRDVTVLDISETAIGEARKRLGSESERVTWLVGEITTIALKRSAYSVWHDRAAFHFLTGNRERIAYVRQVTKSVRPGGHVIVGTFGPEGPKRCSGLDVVRYDAESLHREFGTQFQLLESSEELHRTPSGAVQQFLYCYCRVL